MKKTTILLLILGTAVSHAALTNLPTRERERGRGRDTTRSRDSEDTQSRDTSWSRDDTTRPHTVPEPSSPALLVGGAAGAFILNQRRRTHAR